MEDGFHAFKHQRSGGHARGGLHRPTQKTRLPGPRGNVLRLLVLGRRNVRRLGLRRVLLDRLIRWGLLAAPLLLLRRWRSGLGVLLSQQAAQKAGSMRRLLPRLLYLLPKLLYLPLGLVESDVLHQNRLRQDVERVGIGSEFVAQHILGVGIFFLKLCLVNAIG